MAMTIDGSNGLTFPNSTTQTSGGAPARAWVNYNGVTPTINASYNISSVTRNTAGDYTVNFTTAMTDANYAAVVTSINRETTSGVNQQYGIYSTDNVNPTTYTTTACRISTSKLSNALGYNDVSVVSLVVFR